MEQQVSNYNIYLVRYKKNTQKKLSVYLYRMYNSLQQCQIWNQKGTRSLPKHFNVNQFAWNQSLLHLITFLLSFLSSFFSVSFSEEVVFTFSRRKKEEGKKKNSQCFVFGKFSNLVYCMISSPHLPSPAPLLEVQFIHAFVKIFLKKGVFKLKAYGWYLCGMAIQRRLYWNPLTHANWFLGAFHNAPR